MKKIIKAIIKEINMKYGKTIKIKLEGVNNYILKAENYKEVGNKFKESKNIFIINDNNSNSDFMLEDINRDYEVKKCLLWFGL